MEMLKKKSENVIPKKRQLDDDVIQKKRRLGDVNDLDSREVEKFAKPRTMFCKYPPPKIRTGVRIVRDYPPGCGMVDPVGIKAEKKGLQNKKSVLERLKQKELERRKAFGLRPEGKVKFWDPTCSKEGDMQKPIVKTGVVLDRKPLKSMENVNSKLGNNQLVNARPVEDCKLKSSKTQELVSMAVGGTAVLSDPSCDHKQENTMTVVSQKDQVRREKIKEAMIMFEEFNERLYQENKLRSKEAKVAHWRVPIEAAKLVQKKLKWMDSEKILGPVPGVQVGDTFKYRAQLRMIGLHCQLQNGIDFTMIKGKNVALSIVDAHRYSNESGSSDTLTYCGQGGLTFLGAKGPPEDQKLKRGNLALKNSKDKKTPVRVIRKVHGDGRSNEVFVYDGLYNVIDVSEKKGEEGRMVFKFELKRLPGQQLLHKVRT
ncbi:SRA-YDG, PUA-like domain protein [Artemisia annua]|uniref:SRA-YDG, PUA-like domain protein n=1 Tax=Artemisia annua TaxID=35608 RepID=A0A2U1NYE3_ARTAN|nr:SRA-YDG, PUA-like domain protein [Artemisia annua]